MGMPSTPKPHDDWWQISFTDQNGKPYLRHSSIEPFSTSVTALTLTTTVSARYSETRIPYTEWGGWKLPLAVWIHDRDSKNKIISQQLSYPKASSGSSGQKELPKGTPRYVFPDPKEAHDNFEAEAREKLVFDFQSTIYGKILLDVFDIDRIKSSRRGEESLKQQLKIWLDHEGASTKNSCITFFANNEDDRRHLMFPISWFDLEGLNAKKGEIKLDEKEIKLDFLTKSTKSKIKSREKEQSKQRAATFDTQVTSKFKKRTRCSMRITSESPTN